MIIKLDNIKEINKVEGTKVSTVVRKAIEAGFKVENSIQANIVNNINGLNKSSITISGNQKTGEIPCINLLAKYTGTKRFYTSCKK